MRLSFSEVSIVLPYAVFMAVGQIAFKFTSLGIGGNDSLREAALKLPFSPWFWATGLIYALSMVYWIWVLARVPLSIAYPIAMLSLALVPLFSWLLFSEALSLKYWVGVGLMLGGVQLIVR